MKVKKFCLIVNIKLYNVNSENTSFLLHLMLVPFYLYIKKNNGWENDRIVCIINKNRGDHLTNTSNIITRFSSQCRKQLFTDTINNNEYRFYSVYYPVGNGRFNIDKSIEDIKWIIENKINNKNK